MDALLAQMILDRLEDGGVGDGAADLVLAGCEGEAVLEDALGGEVVARGRDDGQLELVEQPPGAYVASIAVQGFRGIGPRAELELDAGPGLTLVVGRNGSGKSSFAEGLELLMTGRNSRWVKRTKVWSAGWQNLHFGGDTVLSARLAVDGQPGLLELERSWPHGSPVDPVAVRAVAGDGEPVSLDELGWPAALSRYRPFLSYNELGQMFDELKTMYDALSAILGLEDLEELQRCLRDARLQRDKAVKGLRREVAELAARLGELDDDRARAAVVALGTRGGPDLEAVELLLDGMGEDADAAVAALRGLAGVAGPAEDDVTAALDALDAARAKVREQAGTDAARAASLAALLERALEHDAAHSDGDCPVCGTAGVIDESWRLATAREVIRLTGEARAVESALGEVRRRERAVAELAPAAPPAAVETWGREVGLDPGALEVAWEHWAEVRTLVSDVEAEAVPRLRAALHDLREAAAAFAASAQLELARREDVWRPVAKELAAWLPGAREAQAAGTRLADLKAAEQWVRDTADELRADRLAPIADAAKANWDQLRQASNVSLEGFALRRSGNVRAAEVDVRVDGTDASAFGVMSQGELHALAVSVFLPRAGLPESPFRFMVIDDPVQSMDPAKVEGLARVLEQAAARRQVIVFTHDERLPEAVRRLGIDATVREVTRRPESVVEVRTALDPVERALDDARALVRSPDVPGEVVERVVPGFCRAALEAACVEAVRRRRLARGDAHAEVEAALDGLTTLHTHLALALFDDPTRGGDVLTTVNNRFGRPAGDAIRAANKGVHEALGVDPRDLVRHTDVLARALAALT